ncbi:MAG TPA: HNH endonuclease [Fodinibius sp.]|nr:HNH endonuclease [Fodinibius sp.]
MDASVLVLNKDYQPLSICSVHRSVRLLFLDKAEMLHDYPGRMLRTVTEEYSYPSVIRLYRYIHIPYNNIVLSRHNIFKRDANTCQYCGVSRNLTIDHVLPRSRGGGDSWENLVTACDSCNVQKGNRTPKEAGMSLDHKPYRPVHITFFQSLLGGVQEDWKPYLYM